MELDVLIFGGGVAGLWLLDELHRRGFRVVLAESNALGAGQTICAQGIIHGGLKYSLDGNVTSSAQAVREMPARWEASLTGRCAPDLGEVRVLSPTCYLWRTASLKSRAGLFGARMALRTPVERVSREARPAALVDCPGDVLRVEEPVLDVRSLLAALAGRHVGRYMAVVDGTSLSIERNAHAHITSVTLRHSRDGETRAFKPRTIVLAAGSGNESLRAQFGLTSAAMQRRPLHMVLVRGVLPALFGHCIDGKRTRVTITSTTQADGSVVWQVGGQLSEDGVGQEALDLIAKGRTELKAVLPAVDFRGAQWGAYRVDRAEGRTIHGRRPEDCTVRCEGNIVTVWPTKLALAPRLATLVADRLTDSSGTAHGRVEDFGVPDWPRPEIARLPWEVQTSWHRFD